MRGGVIRFIVAYNSFPIPEDDISTWEIQSLNVSNTLEDARESKSIFCSIE